MVIIVVTQHRKRHNGLEVTPLDVHVRHLRYWGSVYTVSSPQKSLSVSFGLHTFSVGSSGTGKIHLQGGMVALTKWCEGIDGQFTPALL